MALPLRSPDPFTLHHNKRTRALVPNSRTLGNRAGPGRHLRYILVILSGAFGRQLCSMGNGGWGFVVSTSRYSLLAMHTDKYISKILY